MTDTLDNLRDELAVACGWKVHAVGYWYNGTEYLPDGHPKDGKLRWAHPFEYGDLTALAAAWPEGWQIAISHHPEGIPRWIVGAGPMRDPIEQGGDTEYEARLRLTIAVRKAMEGA